MAHKTLISGTAYSVTGGRDLIGGTGYDCKAGKTLIGGTAFAVKFSDGLTWYFNSVIDVKDSATYVANFVSDGVTFTAIIIKGGRMGYQRQGASTVGIVYMAAGWRHEKNRTITFEEPPSGALLEWLQANAVQQ